MEAAPDQAVGVGMQPKVTLVIICWNHAAFVEAAVRSAVHQTYGNTELIVFDNDSKDGSPEIIQKLADEFGFQFYRQENIGLVRTLNRALGMATGKYFSQLAADDHWYLDKTERQVAYMEAHPDVHIVCGGMDPVDEHDRPTDFKVGSWPGEVTFESLMTEGCNVQGPTAFYRTETLRATGCFDEHARLEDYTTALHFTAAGHRVVNTGETYTYYRRHSAQWTDKPYYHDRWLVGQLFRSTPCYRGFVAHNLHGYFRWLAGDQKLAAIRLLLTEPLAWRWDDLGIGLVKLMVPTWLVRWRRARRQA